MRTLLEGLLPRLFPDLRFLCLAHQGKQDLERSLPRKLRCWQEPGVRFVVVRDNDGADCKTVKASLDTLCRDAGRQDTLVRIACQELEAWYLGDPEGLAKAWADEGLRRLGRRERFRDPDAVVRPSKALAELVPAFQKVSGARRMAPILDPERNTSRSFRAFVTGVRRLAASATVAPPEREES